MTHLVKSFPRSIVLFSALSAVLVAGSLQAAIAAAAGEEHRYRPDLSRSYSSAEFEEEPCGIAIDSAGNRYVSAPELFAVQVYDPSGETITEFQPEGNFAEPCDLAVDASGAVYVNDLEGMVVKYMPAEPLAPGSEFEIDANAGDGGTIVEAGAFAVAVNPADQHLFVGEGSQISEYDLDGETVAEFGDAVPGASWRGLDVHGGSGALYAIDAQSDQVYVLDGADGSVQATINGAANPGTPGGFGNLNAADLAVDQANGHFYVNNTAGNEVVAEFAASGSFVSQIGPWLGEGEVKLDSLRNFQAVAVDNGATSPNRSAVFVPSSWAKPPLLVTLGIYAFAGELTPTPTPSVANADPTAVTKTAATLKGSVDNEGAQSSSSCKFVLALASAPGTPVAEPPCDVDPVIGNASRAVQADVGGLTPGTDYLYSVVAANSGGTATATPAKAFSTEAEPPIVPNPDPTLIARWEPCEPDTGVTVIVDRNNRLGDGKIHVGCALGEQESGLAALHNAGFATVGVGGGDAFVCRIDGLPTPAEESCAQTPGADRYWSYWHGFPGGRWGYSGFGATSPLSRAPINSVEGWGFGRSPRIEPMDGAGPSAFLLPPEQESSAVPAALAREWLRGVTATSVERALTPGSGVSLDVGDLITKVLALRSAGVPAAQMEATRQFLTATTASGGHTYTALELWANSLGTATGIDPEDPSFPLYGNLARYTQAALVADALGGDPGDFATLGFRESVASLIDEGSGKVRRRVTGGGEELSEAPSDLAAVLNALAASGPLPAKALKTVELLVAQQEGDGGFGVNTGGQAMVIRALAGARAKGAGDLNEPLEAAGGFIAALQEPDGSVRAAAGGGAGSGPTFAATAAGAVGLALSGFPDEAERAAMRLSRFQVIAAYVGVSDPSSGETAPAEPLIGAFLPTEADLRHVLAHGLPENGPHGPYNEAHLPTAQALEALELAGPYGPLSASLSQESVWFGKQALGSRSATFAVTLTNEDERPLPIATVQLAGAVPGDFVVDGGDCSGRTLPRGQSCEVGAAFAPTATGTREALVEVVVTGSGQTFELSLGGTGVPAPATEPPSKVGPQPQPQLDLRPPGARAISPFKANRRATRRVIAIARLSCPEGGTCWVKLPRKLRLKIAGKRYRATVVGPRRLQGGGSAILRLRLPKRALLKLTGRRTHIKLTVEIVNASGSVSRTVKIRVQGRGSP